MVLKPSANTSVAYTQVYTVHAKVVLFKFVT